MRNSKGQFVKRDNMPTKICGICNTLFEKSRQISYKQWGERIVCSNNCKKKYRSLYFKHTESSKEKNRLAHIGKVTMSGESHYNWKGGITPFRKKVYFSQIYKNWRKSVFERDDYTCQFCNKRGGCLNADHIKQWAFYPEVRFDLSNGRTLCVDCHRKTKTWGNRILINNNL